MTVYLITREPSNRPPPPERVVVILAMRLHRSGKGRGVPLPPELAVEPVWACTGCGVFVNQPLHDQEDAA